MITIHTQQAKLVDQEEVITRKKIPSNLALRAIILTSSSHKQDEYKKDLAEPYGLTVSFADSSELTEDVAKQILRQTNPSPHFIIREESQLCDAKTGTILEGRTIAEHPEMAPEFVRNSAYLTVFIPKWNKDDTLSHLEQSTYRHSLQGYIDAAKKDQRTEDVFGWDHVFVNPITGLTNKEAASKWGKLSARQQVLSDFIHNQLFYKTPQTLTHHTELNPKHGIEFTPEMDVAHFMQTNRYLSNPQLDRWGLGAIRERILNEGVFFKAAENRPMKNYFTPPFAGIPLTPKKSDVEETVFMMHDLNHHTVPDLIFDGDGSVEMRNVYVVWRMMSEAMTMIIADMFYADTLVKTDPANREKVDSRIYPLFEALDIDEPTDANREQIFKQLLWANVRFAILGDDSEWRKLLKPGCEGKLEAYKNHFEKFFVGDHNWTKQNFENMVHNKERYTQWIALVGKENFEKYAHVRLLSEAAATIRKRGADLSSFEDVVKKVFDEVIETRIFPPKTQSALVSQQERLSRAFRRYMIGQLNFYSHYRALPGVMERGEKLAKCIQETPYFDSETRARVYRQYKNDVNFVWSANIITISMADNYQQLHPIFPPVYINYTRQESKSIREELYRLYRYIDPSVVYVNTSNDGKFQEYKTYFSKKSVVCLRADVKEPDHDPETIICYKATQNPGVLVDDVALDIEGEDVGTHVRWKLEDIRSGKFTGRCASYVCRVAVALDGVVHIYQASVPGKIVEKKGDCFGFGAYFLPDQTDKTLGEYMDPKFNARAVAIEKYKNGDITKKQDLLPLWPGPFQ